MTDVESLLALIPVDGSIGNEKAQKTLGWEGVRYEAAKNELLNSNRIKLGRGRGGSLRHAVETVFDMSQFSSSEEALLSLIPAGGKVASSKIQKTLGLDDSQFASVLKNLADNYKVMVVGKNLKHWVAQSDLTGFDSDEEALLSLVGSDFTSNEDLLTQTGWEEERLLIAEANLKEQNKLVDANTVSLVGVRLYSLEPRPKDPVVFNCIQMPVAKAVIEKLSALYEKTQFYTSVSGDTVSVHLTRKFNVAMNRDVYLKVCKHAEEAAKVATTPPAGDPVPVSDPPTPEEVEQA